MFFARNRTSVVDTSARSSIGAFLLLPGSLSILFGLAVIAAPELLAYLVAGFFIFIGVSMIGTWWNLRR